MHRNPRNSFFREVATVLHDTEMEIRVKKIGLHDEKLYRFLFIFLVERKDMVKSIYGYLPSSFESRLINLSGKENYRDEKLCWFPLVRVNKHLMFFF